jgi:hypothetical protein
MFLFSCVYKAFSFICIDSVKNYNTWIKQEFLCLTYFTSLVLFGYFVFII